TECADLRGRHLRRSPQPIHPWILHMIGGRAVADFAADAEFVGHDGVVRGDGDWSCGVTAEATEDARCWVESAEGDATGGFVAWGHGVAVKASVPGFAEFAVRLAVFALDEGGGLQAGPERPIAGLAGSGVRQGVGMAAHRLAGEFGFVTG